nr:ATP-binding protein [Burkholderia sp. WP9]
MEVRLPERDRSEVTQDYSGARGLDAVGHIQLLGSIRPHDLRVESGVDAYPRLGDRAYSAPGEFISLLPELTSRNPGVQSRVLLELGTSTSDGEHPVRVTPEVLFGRHCAVLGATGGGKSWTTARLLEECLRYDSKVILLDATGEYRDIADANAAHIHLGSPRITSVGSSPVWLPAENFTESDFLALFEPSGKVQGPKLKEAIRSLRLAKLEPRMFPKGFIEKIGQAKASYGTALSAGANAEKLDDPRQPFDVRLLPEQLEQECVYPEAFGRGPGVKDPTRWGGESGEFSFCIPLTTRIRAVLGSPSLSCVFNRKRATSSVLDEIESFLRGPSRLLRIDLSDVGFEFYAREVVANAIGRQILGLARSGAFYRKPAVAFVDEAHNFLGKRVGSDDFAAKLDAFELVAKEGRKYGLNICLATQRPRDITEGVLSQMGTLIVHRLTNDRDREVVERACGEIDKSSSAFLPSLKQGEAVLIGVDFPIPITIQVAPPTAKPKSDGGQFQNAW